MNVVDQANIGQNVDSQNNNNRDIALDSQFSTSRILSTIIANKFKTKHQFDLELKRLEHRQKLGKVYSNATIF